MQERSELNPAERELEGALKSLAPAAARVNVVAAAFEAGRRSVRPQVRLWRLASAALLLVGIAGSLIPIGDGFQTRRSEIAVGPSPTSARPLAAQSVLMLQAAVREHGLAGLPPTDLPVVGRGHRNDLL